MNKQYEKSIRRYREEILKKAAKHDLSPSLIAAIIIVESSGNPYAIRVEPAFWKRYGKAYNRIISAEHPARRWLKYPDVFAASYGLMQIMFGVAVEHGCRVKFPTELLKPDLNIEYGCRILAKKIKVTKGIESGVLAYNGGGNPNYPSKVFRIMKSVESSDIF